jgi:hypothetical protein
MRIVLPTYNRPPHVSTRSMEVKYNVWQRLNTAQFKMNIFRRVHGKMLELWIVRKWQLLDNVTETFQERL